MGKRRKLEKRLRKLEKRFAAFIAAIEEAEEPAPEPPYSFFVQYEPVPRVLEGHQPLDLEWNPAVEVIPIEDEWGAGTYL